MHPVVAEDLSRIAGAPLPWDALAGRTVVVSGAGGFLAAALVEALLGAAAGPAPGLKIIGLVRDPAKAAARFSPDAARRGLALVAQDLARPLSPAAAATAADFIVHAASHATPSRFGPDPVGTLLPNVEGTRGLLDLARERGTRGFLFVSTSEVYGRVPPAAQPIKESTVGGLLDPLHVRSCYAESKRMGETMCAAWTHQFGVPARVVRPFHVYGPGMPLRDGRVFSDFVADVVERRPLVMKSDGSAVRSYCYLADAVAGMLAALLRGAPGEAYNVGHPGAVASVGELADRLVALFPDRGLTVQRAPAPDAPTGYLPSPIARSVPDVAKLSALGWAPVHGIEAGFRRTVEAFL